MNLSTFVLALWVFLVSTSVQLAWFTVDVRLIGFVGLAFVVIALLETLRGAPLLPARRRD